MIPEQVLCEQIDAFRGWGYSLPDPRFHGGTVGGLKFPKLAPPPQQTNCVAFVLAVIAGAHMAINPAFRWQMVNYERSMLWKGRRPFDPVEVLVERGLADWPANQALPPGDWMVAHGWKSTEAMAKRRGGHTFFIARVRGSGLGRGEEASRVLTVEANDAYGIKGVGHRGIGNLSRPLAQTLAGDLWLSQPGVAWSVRGLRNAYPELRWARLRVTSGVAA